MPSVSPHLPMPTPSTFDILPPLHTLLTRLLLPPSSTTAQSTTTPHPHHHQTLASPPPTSSPALGLVANNSASSTSTTTTISGPLSPKDLITAASTIKIKIQKARAAVQRLPDVERSIEEQEEEIAALKGEVERLKGVVSGIGEAARRAVEGAVKGEGVEV